jgi:NAD(P)-dependent dehydrogenase (short-subunit alcohol dehydrogenase family)
LLAAGRKAAIMTGAASGLGLAMALGLVESGMDVVAVDRNATALAAMTPATAGSPGSILPLPADLIQPDAFDRIVATTLEKFGRIDVLIHTAGIGQASVRADRDVTNTPLVGDDAGERGSAEVPSHHVRD